MTLSSLLIYVVFVDPHQGNKDVMPFSRATTKAYVKFIGREKARAYLQCIYCKVKQRIQRELSHTIKSRCTCVSMYCWIYIVANLILLCSLKTYLSFKTWKHMCQGYNPGVSQGIDQLEGHTARNILARKEGQAPRSGSSPTPSTCFSTQRSQNT